MAETRAWSGDRNPSFDEYLEGLLSPYMRDRLETGCPLAALASEVARQDGAVCESFTRGYEEMVLMLEAALVPSIGSAERRRLSVAAIAAEIGAIAVSRAIAKVNVGLADEVLEATRATFAVAHEQARVEAAKKRHRHPVSDMS